MYQITRITDKNGAAKTEPSDLANLGCVGDAKMEDGCVLFRCRYDKRGEPSKRCIKTSLMKDWKKDKATGRIVVETMNSIYYLDPVKDT